MKIEILLNDEVVASAIRDRAVENLMASVWSEINDAMYKPISERGTPLSEGLRDPGGLIGRWSVDPFYKVTRES